PPSESLIPKDALEALQLVGSIKSHRAKLLRFQTRLVEIAKLPTEEQLARAKELEAASDPEAESWVVDLFARPGCKMAAALARNCSWPGCAAVAMALERYRRDHQAWPAELRLLVPQYVEKLPLDPCDGKPLRYCRFGEGIVIYSVGIDGVDNGGQLDRSVTLSDEGLDLGFRLWDAKHRRQPAKPFKMPGREDDGIND